jgi:cobalt/nickel transport system permease protein
MLWLSVVTPAHRLFQALGALGMPRAWVEVALLMYRYAFVFLDFAEDTITAQRVRLGYAGFRRGLSSAGIAAGTVLVRAVDQAERTGEAMRTRGYIGALPFAPLPALARRDWLALAGTLAAVAASFWWLEGR